mmetsp:Transcript_11828/g.15458  ORF Transcript_11828/g.15458 Transcript_11828/m.15458 type:complete len:446 (+) Transcript_11828:109-1446(+)|eukprot:CAMPEP_0117763024 /NCGR_PEP_ID=MMETSP0947-20121206/18348_1 /TAXON_ID=44440 /ORGANISM="Chattonella subsalsa, Strain CCMP2191" /LENGTH=445 /DNA_ID=CAMNT_0005584565 /DNA_START=38 /DNA_END=1375 /DNA_ORIENTATION=-
MANSESKDNEYQLSFPFDANYLPEFSPATTSTFNVAYKEALKRNHTQLRTEHFLSALLSFVGKDARIVAWMDEVTGGNGVFLSRVLAMLEAHPAFQPLGPLEDRKCNKNTGEEYLQLGETNQQLRSMDDDNVIEEIQLSEAMSQVMHILRQIVCREVVDGSQTYDGGLVATEFVVAAIMLQGTSVAADVIARASYGKVNSSNILSAIGLDPTEILKPQTQSFFSFSTSGEDTERRYSHGAAWIPEPFHLPNPTDFPQPPTQTSNWVIPGHLLIGEKPGGDYTMSETEELQTLLDIGITTFVCLIGEYQTWQRYKSKAYPNKIKQMIEGSKETHNPALVRFIYFPIRDFDIPDKEDLVNFVLELRRRLQNGETLYIHCRGGHGRTGLVVLPLVCSLFNVDNEEARVFVQKSHDNSPRGQAWGGQLPETEEQLEITISINAQVRNAM